MSRIIVRSETFQTTLVNERCTAVIVKKELARQVFVRYSSKCSYLAQMIRHF